MKPMITCPQCGHLNDPTHTTCSACYGGLSPSKETPVATEQNAGFSLLDTNLPTPEHSQHTPQPRNAPHEHDPMLGLQVGNFLLQEKIGEGGYGVVYRAEQVFLKQPFAVKILHANRKVTEAQLERFRREALAITRLRHTQVVQISDFGLLPQGYGFYLVMELLEGESLADLLARQPQLPAARIAPIIRQVCEVLQEAHDIGIYHRDIKPGNIYLIQQGRTKDGVRLLDFGIASMMHEGSDNDLTQSQTVMGSPAYMSPEQARGETRSISGASDLYSLAIALYQMLTGQLPFQGESANAMLFQHAFETPPSLATNAPEKPWAPALDAFLQRALSKPQEERPPSATAFWSACEEALQAQRQLEESPGKTHPQPKDDKDTIPQAVSVPYSPDAQSKGPNFRGRWKRVVLVALFVPIVALVGVWYGQRTSKVNEGSQKPAQLKGKQSQAAPKTPREPRPTTPQPRIQARPPTPVRAANPRTKAPKKAQAPSAPKALPRRVERVREPALPRPALPRKQALPRHRARSIGKTPRRAAKKRAAPHRPRPPRRRLPHQTPGYKAMKAKSIVRWVQALRSGTAQEQGWAAMLLAQVKRPVNRKLVLMPLIRALPHPSTTVRRYAARALGNQNIRAKQAIRRLGARLSFEQNVQVKSEVIRSLGRYGTSAHSQAAMIASSFMSEGKDRWVAGWALERIKADSVCFMLAMQLMDPSDKVVRVIARVLLSYKPAKTTRTMVIRHLRRQLKQTHQRKLVRKKIAQVLRHYR